MRYSAEMNLVSESGYCMPFANENGNVTVLRPYGLQTDPNTGGEVFHDGVDLAVNKNYLHAIGTGKVSAIGVDKNEHGLYLTVKYKKWEVTYAGMSDAYVQFGEDLVAGDCVGVAGEEVLHLGVKYDGELLSPYDFITMLNGNVAQWGNQVNGREGQPTGLDMDVKTIYDDKRKDIEPLITKFILPYTVALLSGTYQMPDATGEALRSLFALGNLRNYFFKQIPTAINPLGLGQGCEGLIAKGQNLMIGDILNYIYLMHNIAVPGIDYQPVKKKTRPSLEGLL